jgi:hypothetical protein
VGLVRKGLESARQVWLAGGIGGDYSDALDPYHHQEEAAALKGPLLNDLTKAGDLGGLCAAAHLLATNDVGYAETVVAVPQVLKHPQVPFLEDLQRQRHAGKQHRIQRKYRHVVENFAGHTTSHSCAVL